MRRILKLISMALIGMGRFLEFQTNNNVVIPELNVDIDQENLEYIMNLFNPLHDDGNNEIYLYNEILREVTIW